MLKSQIKPTGGATSSDGKSLSPSRQGLNLMNVFLEWVQSGRHLAKIHKSTNLKQANGSVTINSGVENTGESARGANSESPGLKLKVENYTETPSMVASNVGGSIRSRSGRELPKAPTVPVSPQTKKQQLMATKGTANHKMVNQTIELVRRKNRELSSLNDGSSKNQQ